MFRLIKLAVYALIGYAAYEIYQGLTTDAPRARGGSPGNKPLDKALNSSSGRMAALTGEGVGERQQTLDADGASLPHQVGRGVIHR